jgi:hypothetical protein
VASTNTSRPGTGVSLFHSATDKSGPTRLNLASAAASAVTDQHHEQQIVGELLGQLRRRGHVDSIDNVRRLPVLSTAR